jgi:hypothetical protein
MRTIRASEIASFLFCQRAWWYHRHGIEPGNPKERAYGSQIHIAHGRKVMAASCLKVMAYGLIMLALALLYVYFTMLAF